MDTSDLAGAVLAAAAGDDPERLAAAIGELRAAAGELAALAEAYFGAAQVVARSASPTLPHNEGTGRLGG